MAKGRAIAMRIPYSKVIRKIRFFRPSKAMKRQGFEACSLGPESTIARERAWALYEEWTAVRTGQVVQAKAAASTKKRNTEEAELARVWPSGSIGHAYVKYMNTNEWKSAAFSTRQRDRLPAWSYIRDAWGEGDPNLMTLDLLSNWRKEILDAHGKGVAHRVFKEWRRHWKCMMAMRYTHLTDPSSGITNSAPKGRWQTWQEGEIVRMVKAAIRNNDLRLAAIIASIWDTQFSPGDVRSARARHLIVKPDNIYFDKQVDGREKTEKAALGTLSKRGQRVVRAYLATRPDMLPDAVVFPYDDGIKELSITQLTKLFRAHCSTVFPGDKRQMRDMRRTGTVEAFLGGADPVDVGNKMANSIATSATLQKTYNPVELASVKRADNARIKGRQIRREANK